MQVIQPAAPFALPLVDLSGLPESAARGAGPRLAGEEAGRPFDLARGPLLRGVLLRLVGEETTSLALTMHHIVSDGWSMGILVREVAALYAAFAGGRPSPLPELPVQYADFAVWQRSWLHGEVLEGEIAFWRAAARGPAAAPGAAHRPAAARGAELPRRLAAGAAAGRAHPAGCEALARREGATLFMVLLAGFQALLARYSGQEDLAVGSPVAGRNRVEIEGLIGFFVNTLVLRGDLTGDAVVPRAARPGARDRAGRLHAPGRAVRKAGRGAGAGEEPRALAPVPGDVRAAERSRRRRIDLPGLRLRPPSRRRTPSKFDLGLTFTKAGGESRLERAPARFRGRSVRCRHDRPHGRPSDGAAGRGHGRPRAAAPRICRCCPKASATSSGPSGTTRAATPLAERAGSGRAFRGAGAPHAGGRGRGARRGRGTRASPTASSTGGRTAWPSACARWEPDPECRWALCVERTPELVVGVLADLKSGGACSPLDPPSAGAPGLPAGGCGGRRCW